MKSKFAIAALAIGAAAFLAAAPAQAQYRHGGGGGYYHGGGHRGGGWGGAGAGFVAGALLGGMIASQPRYYGPGYYAEPGYAYAPGDEEAYCAQRYRSYDPESGTFLGYDGLRHPCP